MDVTKTRQCVLYLRCILTVILSSTCSSFATTVPPTPSPPFLPQTYQVDIQCNIVNKGYTMEATVYYDYLGNRASISLLRNGLQGKMIFNYATNEIYTVSEGTCTVSDLSTSMYTQMFGEIQSNGMPHIAIPQTSFKFGKHFNTTYDGTTTIRGIPATHWKSSVVPDGYLSLNTDYYFSSNWSTASSLSSVPVRVEIAGYRQNGSTGYTFHHIYDYYNFRAEVDPVPAVFQTGANIICPGRKSGRPLPTLPKRFHYRTERILNDIAAITFEDVWYDETLKVFRRNYSPLISSESADNTLHPMSEIHDFSKGVRYVIDNAYGNCTILGLSNYSMDTMQDIHAKNTTGAFELEMKNPLQLFKLDWNYTYIGQETARGILCDMYVADRDHLTVNGFVNNAKTSVTFYFLATEWTDIPDGEKPKAKQTVPIQMKLLSDEIGLTAIYNFVDFDPAPPIYDVFDVSQCYKEANKLRFKVTFPGAFVPSSGPSLKEWSHLTLAQVMDVSIIRVTDFQLEYDDANVFVLATLLDKTPTAAQFTYIMGRVSEHSDDSKIPNVRTPMFCADLCVNSTIITCNSFDYCQNDQTCRLSSQHVSEGIVLNFSKTCDHFSRNVNGLPPEKSITAAFRTLQGHVYNRSLVLKYFYDKIYTAVEVSIIFGWMDKNVRLPNISDHFSYKLEVSVPSQKSIYTGAVWYDQAFKLLRYDIHSRQHTPPYFSTDPITIIEDYGTGLKYTIDKQFENCTISTLTQKDFGVLDTAKSNVVMKGPLVILHIDKTYSFVGQQTIRGVVCNVFESLRSDYQIPTYNNNKTYSAVFRYAFLANTWIDISEGYLGSSDQPIRLEITVLEISFYMQYNFFDFATDHPSLAYFDIHNCYDSTQMQNFQVTFPGKHHPYLDTNSKIFLLEALFRMANHSGVPVLRLQRPRVDYVRDYIFVTATLIDRLSNMFYFTKKATNVTTNNKGEVANGNDVYLCSDHCVSEGGFECNSFMFCPGFDVCILKNTTYRDTTGPFEYGNCDFYSKITVNTAAKQPSNLIAFLQLKNSIYAGNLTIEIPVTGTNTVKTFVASTIRTDVVSEQVVYPKALSQFKLLTQRGQIKSLNDKILPEISIDDCAGACVSAVENLCGGFSYDVSKQECVLTRNHTDHLTHFNTTTNAVSYLYSRIYTSFYSVQPVKVSNSTADLALTNITSNADCAEKCFWNTGLPCKAFLYSSIFKQCRMFRNRKIGKPASAEYMDTDNTFYTSSYDADFIPVDAGQYNFGKVLQLSVDGRSLTKKDCATFCIEQLGNDCKGFYHCEINTCYLTNATIGDGSGLVSKSMSQIDFCHKFSRTFFPSTEINTASTASFSSTTPKPSISITTSKSSISKTTPKQNTGPSTSRPNNPATIPSSTDSMPPSTSTLATGGSNSPLKQGHDNTTQSTGMVAGVGVGAFVFGIIIGMLSLYIFRRYSGYRDELRTNFIEHEEM